jgi:F-type H+-transporting ATPase subunit a
MAEHSANPLDHVVDHPTLEFPWFTRPHYEVIIDLPKIPILGGIQITRFMVMELVAGVLLIIFMIPVARHIARTPVSRGWFMNMIEAVLMFVRDKIARPSIGGHGADKFLPYLWTVFFFILFNNLLGMFPGFASPTGNINMTIVLGLATMVVVLMTGMREMGAVGFWVGIVPQIDVPKLIKPAVWTLLFFIEVAGLLIRHIVLAVRLFANMFAGHVVLSVILGFTVMAWSSMAFWLVAPVSIGGVVALSLLELFVALLQAYVFTFLSAMFIGSAAHPH